MDAHRHSTCISEPALLSNAQVKKRVSSLLRSVAFFLACPFRLEAVTKILTHQSPSWLPGSLGVDFRPSFVSPALGNLLIQLQWLAGRDFGYPINWPCFMTLLFAFDVLRMNCVLCCFVVCVALLVVCCFSCYPWHVLYVMSLRCNRGPAPAAWNKQKWPRNDQLAWLLKVFCHIGLRAKQICSHSNLFAPLSIA